MITLDEKLAGHMARIALGHVTKEYPHKLDQVLSSKDDIASPRALHPIFFGSFDWHSCVHSWWTLLTLRRLFPQMVEAGDIAELAHSSFTRQNVAAELAYLDRPYSRGFERPYGWAWLLQLHLEAARHEDRWAAELECLARAFADRLRDYLGVLTYPIRVGTHFNTAFAMILSLDWAEAYDEPLGNQIRGRSRHWFGSDSGCQAWEPGGDEFLSSALTEALCMARTDPDQFKVWFRSFLPFIDQGEPLSLLTPASVSDRSDGKIAHLDGLNLSRAWCWKELAALLSGTGQAIAKKAADAHFNAAIDQLSGDFMGEHWLASFALLALLAG